MSIIRPPAAVIHPVVRGADSGKGIGRVAAAVPC